MLLIYKKRMNISLGVWFVFILTQVVLKKSTYGDSIFYLFSYIGATAAMIYGCYASAKGKGYSGLWGLLGVFNIIGFIVLVFFPDKNK